MRGVLSVDMEGIAHITEARQVLPWHPEYWDDGRRYLTDDVVAAAHGLLEGGASEVVVLDNHGAGNPWNIILDELPDRARGETWNVFDLPAQGVEAMLQVGYHPRAGVAGFLPHSYIPGLRLWVDGEPISESHGRIWAARAALLGIVGHAAHGRTLGSLAGTPFLITQEGDDPHHATPTFEAASDSAEAIRDFARNAMRGVADAHRPRPPADATFRAVLDDADADQCSRMREAGWTQAGDGEFTVHLAEWSDARDPLAGAMGAALAPFSDIFGLELTSREAFERQDREATERLTRAFLEWTARMAVPDGAPA